MSTFDRLTLQQEMEVEDEAQVTTAALFKESLKASNDGKSRIPRPDKALTHVGSAKC